MEEDNFHYNSNNLCRGGVKGLRSVCYEHGNVNMLQILENRLKKLEYLSCYSIKNGYSVL